MITRLGEYEQQGEMKHIVTSSLLRSHSTLSNAIHKGRFSQHITAILHESSRYLRVNIDSSFPIRTFLSEVYADGVSVNPIISGVFLVKQG